MKYVIGATTANQALSAERKKPAPDEERRYANFIHTNRRTIKIKRGETNDTI
jgi:hypothetical protein